MSYDENDTALRSAGYYNTSENGNNHMMTPTGIEVTESKDYHLETMMIMGM